MYKDAAVGFGELSKKFEDLVTGRGLIEGTNARGMGIRCPVLFPVASELLFCLILKGGDADRKVSEDSEAGGDWG